MHVVDLLFDNERLLISNLLFILPNTKNNFVIN